MLLRRCKLDYINQKSLKIFILYKKLKVSMKGQFFFRSVSILQSLKGILLRMTKNEFGQARKKSVEHQENYEKRFSMFFVVCVSFVGVIGAKVY